MQKYEKAVLIAALADIEHLAAPSNIDAVCAVLGVEVVSFARRGSAGMKADIEAVIANPDAMRPPKKRTRARKPSPAI